MNENTMQIIAALVVVNLVAWGGFVALEKDPEIIYKYRDSISESANVTVIFDFGELSNESVTFFTNTFNNTTITSVSYDNVLVKNDTSAYAATIVAAQMGGFSLTLLGIPLDPIFIP